MSKKVYLIRAAQFYKIGISGNIQSRLKSIQTGCPIKCEYIGYFPHPEPETLEKQLHTRFVSFKTFGEWFDLGDDNIKLLIAEFNFKQQVNPMPIINESTQRTSNSKELKNAREISSNINEIESVFGEFFPEKCFTDSGKDTVRKLLIAFGSEIVIESLRHLAEKFDSGEIWDKWKNTCKCYKKYGRHVPDNVWFAYFKIKKSLGVVAAIAFIEHIMENELENDNGLTNYVGRNASNGFRNYGGIQWNCINSYLNNE